MTGFDCFILKKLYSSRPGGRQPRDFFPNLVSTRFKEVAHRGSDIAMAMRDVAEAKPAVQLDAAVFGATVQLPSFDKIEPNAWFAVADANFALRKVTDSTTRYYYVLSKLDATTLRKLTAFLNRPRGDDPYNEIKRQLCKTFEPSREQKLDALLATSSWGDERPMEFGLELQRLLGDSTTDDILKRIFLRSAPPAIALAIKPFRRAKFEETS